MRILLANLKHLYQRRSLWIVYAGLGLIVWFVMEKALSAPTRGNGLFGGFLTCCFLLGLLVGTAQMETASKPFSFCLPGHRDAVRKLVFLVGLVVSLAFFFISVALLASRSFAGPFEQSVTPRELLVLALGAYFCASVTAFLLGAGVAFSVIHSTSALSLMTLAVAACAVFDAFTTIQYPMLHWPVAVIVLAVAVGLASWWWLGRPAWFRRSCARPWMGLFDPWDRTQIQKHRAAYATRSTRNISPEMDRFFQRVIGTRRPYSLGKYAWGALYTTCVLIAPQWKGLLSVALLAGACAAYFPPMALMLVAGVSVMMASVLPLPLCTTLLVTGGRKERFFATVALILVLGMVLAVLVGVSVSLTHGLASLVPAVTVRGFTLHPQAIGFKVLLVPLALLPIVGLVQTLFYRKPVWLALSVMLLITLMMWSSTPLGLYRAVTPMVAIGVTVLTWGVCMSALYRIAMYSDLVRQ